MPYLLKLEDVLVEVMLETFIGKVDAELFKAVVLEVLKTKNVQHSDGQDLKTTNVCESMRNFFRLHLLKLNYLLNIEMLQYYKVSNNTLSFNTLIEVKLKLYKVFVNITFSTGILTLTTDPKKILCSDT